MTREEFNKLEFLKQLEYINNLLVEGKSLRGIGLDLKMQTKTFRNRFYSIGYILNKDTNQYYYDNTIVIKKTQKVHKAVVKPIEKDNTKALQKYDIKEKPQSYNKDNLELINKKTEILEIKTPQKVAEPIVEEDTKVLQKYDIKEKSQSYDKDLLELINKKTELLEMLENYKNTSKVIEKPQLNISSLPQELQNDIINKSIKIYEPVYKLFDEVCQNYSSFKKQNLISLALYEFCDKYKK